MAPKKITIRVMPETRALLSEVSELLYERGLERLPLSVREGLRELGDGQLRLSLAHVTHLGLLALHRHLTDDPPSVERRDPPERR